MCSTERHPRAQKVAHIGSLDLPEIPQAQPDFLVDHKRIDDGDSELQTARSKRCNGGAAYAHFREAHPPVNQAVVQPDVDNQREQRDVKTDVNRFRAAQNAQQKCGNRENAVGETDDAQILGALGDDGPFIGQQRKHRLREAVGDDGEDEGNEDPQPEADRKDSTDGFRFALPPIL